MKDTWNMTPDEARKYILQNWFDGDENVNAFVCGDEEYTAMAIAVEALEATRWHYLSKGEYPTVGSFNPYMSDKCLVYVDEDGINKHLDMAYYDFREKGWVKFPVPAREEWLNVYAWQYIVPPKEEE